MRSYRGGWLRQERQRRGLSQKNVATIMGISGASLSQIELHNLLLSDKWLRRLAVEGLVPTQDKKEEEESAEAEDEAENEDEDRNDDEDDDADQQVDEEATAEEPPAPTFIMPPELAYGAMRRVVDYHVLIGKVENLGAEETIAAVFQDMKQCGLFGFVDLDRLSDAMSLLITTALASTHAKAVAAAQPDKTASTESNDKTQPVTSSEIPASPLASGNKA